MQIHPRRPFAHPHLPPHFFMRQPFNATEPKRLCQSIRHPCQTSSHPLHQLLRLDILLRRRPRARQLANPLHPLLPIPSSQQIHRFPGPDAQQQPPPLRNLHPLPPRIFPGRHKRLLVTIRRISVIVQQPIHRPPNRRPMLRQYVSPIDHGFHNTPTVVQTHQMLHPTPFSPLTNTLTDI